jgi:hypothetical protein
MKSLKKKVFKPNSLTKWIKNRKIVPTAIRTFINNNREQNQLIQVIDWVMSDSEMSQQNLLEAQLKEMYNCTGISEERMGKDRVETWSSMRRKNAIFEQEIELFKQGKLSLKELLHKEIQTV